MSYARFNQFPACRQQTIATALWLALLFLETGFLSSHHPALVANDELLRLDLLDGRSTAVQLVGLGSNGFPIFKEKRFDTGPKSNPIIDSKWDRNLHLRLGSPIPNSSFDILVLQNGSRIACVISSIGKETIDFTSRIFDATQIPTGLVRGIIFRQKTNRVVHQRTLDTMYLRNQKEMSIVLMNGDVVKGVLQNNKGANSEKIAIQMKQLGQTRDIPLEEIEHVILAGQLDGNKIGHNRMGFNDGTILVFEQCLVKDKVADFQLENSLNLHAPLTRRSKQLIDRIVYFQSANPSFRFLSESEPLRIVDKSDQFMLKPRINRSCEGGPLVSRARIFEMGLGTTSGTQIIYAVDESDRVFRASVALDDSSANAGHAVCRVVVLDKKENRWKSGSKSFEIGPDKDPVVVEVDVSTARAIGLVTGAGKRGNSGDRVNWLDARFHR